MVNRAFPWLTGCTVRPRSCQYISVNFKWKTGQVYRPNLDLDMTRSHHFILGYEKYVREASVKLKTEAYYQQINRASRAH